MSDTQPTSIKKSKNRFGLLLSLLILLGALALGSFGGYGMGIGARVAAAEATQVQSLSEQLAFAQQDFDARHFENARQRLEFIINADPGYPGASDLLAQVLVQMAITPTPTLTPTPTITPTPDLREQEIIFAQAQQQLAGGDWSATLATLDGLRKRDPSYRAAQVDGMYYSALRNRGVSQILGTGAYADSPNLEGGIYDLTLAERFGPLDGTSDGLRSFARQYIQGASYWEIDWYQAMTYFGEVSRMTPNLRDASNVTATERYRIALLRYGDVLAANGKLKDRCQALDYWTQSFNMGQPEAGYQDKFNALYAECVPPTATPEPILIEPTLDPNLTPVATP